MGRCMSESVGNLWAATDIGKCDSYVKRPAWHRILVHSQNWYSRWGRRFYFKVAAESFPSWDTIRGGHSFRTVMEFTFKVRSKLLTFSLRKLSTSSFILNLLECGPRNLHCPLIMQFFFKSDLSTTKLCWKTFCIALTYMARVVAKVRISHFIKALLNSLQPTLSQ